MSDDQKDVLIAAYLFEDLAKKDFEAVLKLAEDKTITVEGVVLVQKDADGEVHVQETGDHLGRKGAKVGGGVGLVVGLFAPPLLAATAVGAAAGARDGQVRQAPTRERHRRKNGRRPTTRVGGRDRHLRLRRPRRSRRGTRQRRQEIRGTDRRHERQRAQGRTRRSPGRNGRKLNGQNLGTASGVRLGLGRHRDLGLIIWVLIAFWPARVARRKGHSWLLFFIFSLFFFPLALLVAYMVRDRRRA